MLLGLSSLFETHPPFMYVDLVVSLCTLESGDKTWMQTDRHSLVLKPVSGFETLAYLISICLTNFSFPWKSFLSWYLKSPAGVLQ